MVGLDIFFYFFILVISFYFLMKSADYLVSSSSILGQRAGLSKFVIGLTLVAIGTSLPELFTAIIAIVSSKNPSAFILGTIIGSNISNILLIFGILILFSKNFHVNIKIFDTLFLVLSTLSLAFIIFLGKITMIYSITFLFLFVMYLYSTVRDSKKRKVEKVVDEVDQITENSSPTYYLIIIFLLSLAGLNVCAKGVVFSIENLGVILNIPLEFLTLTTVAFATSLPEMVVTYSSAKKSEFDLAIGNIIGSNISNIFLIIGVSGILKNIVFETSTYFISIFVMIISTIIFLSYLMLENVKKYNAFILFLIYVVYVFLIF